MKEYINTLGTYLRSRGQFFKRVFAPTEKVHAYEKIRAYR
jgi:hypothetical protein